MDGWATAVDIARRALGGETQDAFARRAGISQATVSNFLGMKKRPGPETVERMEDALRLDPGDLGRHLGYLSTAARDVTAPEAAIKADATLTPKQRRALLDALDEYRALNRLRES